MKKILVIGYGNPDRGDDGVAWHILGMLANKFGIGLNNELFEKGIMSANKSVDMWFNLQLVPEIAEDLHHYQRAIFIDAHTTEIQEDIRVIDIKPLFQNSPFTHHLTPSSCLSITQTLYGRAPKSILVSIKGFEFDFSNLLSPQTQVFAEKALTTILYWIDEEI